MPTGHRPGAEQVWPTRSARIRSGAHEPGPEPSSARPGGDGHDYWNHNVAYHRWIIDAVARHGRCRVLDVGCGGGLLLQHLAPLVASATGVEKDEISVGRARARLAGEANTLLVHCDFEQFVPDEDGYDLITFVASLHHMDPRAALTRAARMLRPGGELLVVGLTANRSPLDWAFSALTLPVARFGSLVHHETRDIGVPVAGAREDLREIRRIAREILPGARIRRGLYYRYLLRWTGSAG